MNEVTTVFEWVSSLSPWWWVAFGVGLGAVEMATMSFFLIGPAVAAIVMALIVAFGVPMSGGVLVSLWSVLSIALTLLGRSYLLRFGDGGGTGSSKLNNRSSRLVGRRAKVLEWSENEGAVEVDGMRWRAKSQIGSAYNEGAPVEIVDADGMTLTVRAT